MRALEAERVSWLCADECGWTFSLVGRWARCRGRRRACGVGGCRGPGM